MLVEVDKLCFLEKKKIGNIRETSENAKLSKCNILCKVKKNIVYETTLVKIPKNRIFNCSKKTYF